MFVVVLNASCGAIINKNKPDAELRNPTAMAYAMHYGVVEKKDSYFYGNLLLLVLFPIGTVIGAVGFSIQ